MNHLRDLITKAYRMNENECVDELIQQAFFSSHQLFHIHETAKQLVIQTREYKKRQQKLDKLMHQYDLSTEEGIALMCLAEALLRIPDTATMDKFISDKLSTVEWKNHLNADSLFVNAATWSLLITGKIYAPALDRQTNLLSSLKRVSSRVGAAMIRPLILQMMKAIGNQFVIGQTIQSALKRSAALEKKGYSFSYDMLGEAARTKADAAHYFEAYHEAICAIGEHAKAETPAKNPGISVKLSALHPRYEYTQYELVMKELPPLLLSLAQLAKKYNIGLTVDAEEADRLDLSLDIFEKVFSDSSLEGWEGLGLAVQAYQKRAYYVIDWLSALSQKNNKKIMVRLVKGAYWDAEIKLSQVQGQIDYPVFTRKNSTDVSYIACAKKLLSQPDCFYPQFGTHNAYSVAAIMELAAPQTDFEFQCLQGMGRPLYDQMVEKNYACRIYAPVGTHKDLLGYLVRRLLENGANSSFVNKLADDKTPVENMVIDPVARMAALENKYHPRIPLPKNMYGEWQNSQGIDLSNSFDRSKLEQQMANAKKEMRPGGSIVNGKTLMDEHAKSVSSPNDINIIIGRVSQAKEEDVEKAIESANKARQSWELTSVF